MTSKIARILLFGAAFAVLFVVGLRLTFPMGLVTRVVEAQAEAATDFKWDIDIGSARFSGLVGIKLHDIEVRPVIDRDQSEPVLPLRIDSARVRVGLFSLLRRRPAVRADLRLADGKIRAAYTPAAESKEIRIELFDVDTGRIGPIRRIVGMPVSGSTSGTIVLSYEDEWQLSGGNVEVGIAGLVLGPGEIRSRVFRQFGGAVPLPATNFGNVVIRTPIEGSNIRVQQFEASGTDVRLNASGEVQLRSPMRTSRVDLNVDFQLDGRYVEAAGLGAVFGLPEVQRLQVGDGYAFAVSGPIGRPSLVPAARRGL